jgi:tetratricopeptide (TPR) repeat protein
MRTVAAIMVALAAQAIAASPARAEPTPTQVLARKHYETGKSYYAIANYREARDEFEKAYRLEPLPALLYNIARCDESLGDLRQAIGSYRRYLASDKGASDRSLVEARIANLERRLETEAAAARARPSDGEPPAGARWRRPTAWAAIGAGGAALVVGIVAGAMVRKKNDEYAAGAAPDGGKTYAELERIADAGRRWQSAELATLVAGGALAAVGGSLLLWDALAGKRSRAREHALGLAPFAGRASFGVAGRLRF